MKTLRFIGMALFAILMCVNLASCSSSGDDPTEEKEEGGVVVNSKKIIKMTNESEKWGRYTYTFSYDTKGRLTEATNSHNGESYSNYSVVWGDDAIMVYHENGSKTTYSLENNLVQTNNIDEIYTYNKSNRIVKIEEDGGTHNYIWEGDKLMSTSFDDGYSSFTRILSYGKSCKGYFPNIAIMVWDDYCLYMAHPELIGARTNQLPTSETWTYISTREKENVTMTYTYEFDKEGYVTNITAKGTDGSTETYSITWQ